MIIYIDKNGIETYINIQANCIRICDKLMFLPTNSTLMLYLKVLRNNNPSAVMLSDI